MLSAALLLFFGVAYLLYVDEHCRRDGLALELRGAHGPCPAHHAQQLRERRGALVIEVRRPLRTRPWVCQSEFAAKLQLRHEQGCHWIAIGEERVMTCSRDQGTMRRFLLGWTWWTHH